MLDVNGALDVVGGVGGVSLSALCAAFVYALLSGKLFTRAHLGDVRDNLEKRVAEVIKERDDWKVAWMASEEARRVEAYQKNELLEVGRLTNQLLQTLKEERGTR